MKIPAYALPSYSTEPPPAVADARDALIASVDDGTEQQQLIIALDGLDEEARDIRVKCGEHRMSMADLLFFHCRSMREKPKEHTVLMHPGWAHHPDGWSNLLDRATIASHSLSREYHAQLGEAWKDQFNERMRRVIASHASCILFRDPTIVDNSPEPALDACGRRTLFTRKMSEGATGHPTAQALAQYFHLTQGWTPEDHTTVHGATHGRCPKRFAQVLQAATDFGIYLPHPVDALHPDHIDTILEATARGRFYERSRIRFGAVLDCEGVYPKQKSAKAWEPVLQFSDRNTVIYPDTDSTSMNLVRSRFA